MTKQNRFHDLNANRDVIIGDQITYQIQMPAFQPPPDLEALRKAYLDHLRRMYRVLDFRGIPQLESFSREMQLEDVYVPLVARPERPEGDTWMRGRLAGRDWNGDSLSEDMLAMAGKGESVAPVPVEQALGEHSRVIVLGDPGSGKSTLLKFLTLRLAAEKDAPLPIILPLNAFARALKKKDRSLQAYLPQYFAGLTQGIANLEPLFTTAIQKGQAVVLLDGLDEVQANRHHLVHKVETFAASVVEKGNKIVVTSRIVGYRDAPLAPKDWALYTLLDFDRQAIEDFTRKWCLAFETSTRGNTPEARADAELEQRSLLESIDSSPGVAQLASNPLLLTILALIKRQGVALPNRRVELYELYLDTLIRAWNKARALDRQQIGPDMNPNDILAALGPLALWLREENPTAGVVSERALLGELTRYYMGDDWGLKRGPALTKACEFLKSVRRYSNLLVERGRDQYGFLHLTFEEMLAAYGLYQKAQLDLSESLAIIQEHLTDPAWRETILLAVGVWGLANRQPRVAGKVVAAMLEMDCPPEQVGQNVLIAGACLEDVGEEGIGRATARKVQDALVEAARDRALPPAVQRDAGFLLARTGWQPEDLDDFISIPAGTFLYGDEKREEEIDAPFEMAKYPVTNLQYRRFIEAEGYHRRELWSEDGWAWRMGDYDSKAPEDYQEWLEKRPPDKRGEPFFWHDRQWNNPLAPVVGVSWFEAEAYCNWLSEQRGVPVRLPTEREWERAARGVDGRTYPWGEDFDRRKLNCAEFWAKEDDLSDYDDLKKWWDSDSFENASTTQAGQFPQSQSPDGLMDMSGNVFEWTKTWWADDHVYRVVRGGSWDYDRRYVRCAYRSRLAPDLFGTTVGFRVVSPG
jgi:formylglycine-generating enzyme required for sulfatase activity/energy-coupling factor transporter ATP-binding protein EcfA2